MTKDGVARRNMSTFVNNDVSPGSVVLASDHNTQGALIAAAVNGGLENSNIASNAAIAGSKLADASITPAKWTNPYRFRAYHNTTQAITTAGAVVAFNTESYDPSNNFASNTYTAPVAGTYNFSAQTAWAATGSQTRCVLYLSINGAGTSGIVLGDVSTGAAAFGINGSTDVTLAASDTVAIFFLPVGATTTLRAGGANTASTYFTGHLVHAT